MAGSTTPSTFMDAMSKVQSDLGAALMLPDANVPMVMKLMIDIKSGSMPKQGGPGGGPGGPPPGAGGPPPGAGGPPPGAPPGMAPPGGPPGASPANPAMGAMGAPKGPQSQNGLTQGLSPNPDEMRRVIQQMTAG